MPQRLAEEIFQADWQKVIRRTDRMFLWLLLGQWLFAILIALVWSPRTWIAQYWAFHQHVIAAVLLGGLFAAYPIYLILCKPGAAYTRHVIAIGQMLQSALLVHVTGGRVETHFHVFGSLALLAFYRDWTVLITGAAVVYLDHIALGIWFPLSAYGVTTAPIWRAFEHAFWVIFEGVFLTMACRNGIRDLREIAERQARQESINEEIEKEVASRTSELKDSELRFRRLVDFSPAPMLVSAGGKIVYANGAAARILGFGSPEELVGKTPKEFVHPDYHAVIEERLRQLMDEGREVPMIDEKFIREDGKVIDVEVASMRTTYAGAPAVHSVFIDVTQRKRAEVEMARARDAALEQTRLKSEFLANMSHEIRTPMNGVLGYLGLLEEKSFSGEKEMMEFVRGAKSSAESLLSLINDILDFSKIEAGKLKLESIDFDVRSVVEETVESLAPKAAQKGVELASIVEYGVPLALHGDPTRLKQILLNLTGNAVKFTEKGEIVLRVSLLRETETDCKLRFSVRDSGIGIPADKHHLIFQSFTQADGSSTRRYGGTGLGLTISKQLTELMGGTVDFRSEAGKGSEFWFEVSLSKNLAGQPVLNTADVRGTSVLVVDDNEVNRDILCRMVESFGCRAVSAARASDALTLLQKRLTQGDPIQLAVLDFQMPDEDGLKLARQIKSNPALRETKLVLLTSVGQRGDAALAKDAGFSAYLNKPVRQSFLLDTMITLMARAKEDAPHEEEAPLITRHSIKEARRGASILLAEDNPVNQTVAKAILSKCGYEVTAASCGIEALELLKERNFDLVLMDVQMPDMDGLEATREIRKLKGPKAKTPIIAMTAHAMAGDRDECLQAGMDDYLSKPINPIKLKHTIERWLGKTAGVTPLPETQAVSANDEPVDLEVMRRISGGDSVFEAELAKTFLADSQRLLTSLEESLHKGELKRVAADAHSLKGSAANVGAKKLSKISAQVERVAALRLGSGSSTKPEEGQTLIAEAKKELERIRRFMPTGKSKTAEKTPR